MLVLEYWKIIQEYSFQLIFYSFIHSLMYQISTKLLRGAGTSLGVKVKGPHLCLTIQPRGLLHPWDSPGQNTGVSILSLLQGIIPTQGSNSGLPHCRWILYQLSHKRSPRILEWVAYPISHGSSQPRIWTRVSCTAGKFFTKWAIREAQALKIHE